MYALYCEDLSDCSPIGSRPPSPKSDSEYETQKYDATCQTQLTGDELMLLDDIKWVWGEFPQPSPTPAKTPSASSDGSSKKGDILLIFLMTLKVFNFLPVWPF